MGGYPSSARFMRSNPPPTRRGEARPAASATAPRRPWTTAAGVLAEFGSGGRASWTGGHEPAHRAALPPHAPARSVREHQPGRCASISCGSRRAWLRIGALGPAPPARARPTFEDRAARGLRADRPRARLRPAPACAGAGPRHLRRQAAPGHTRHRGMRAPWPWPSAQEMRAPASAAGQRTVPVLMHCVAPAPIRTWTVTSSGWRRCWPRTCAGAPATWRIRRAAVAAARAMRA